MARQFCRTGWKQSLFTLLFSSARALPLVRLASRPKELEGFAYLLRGFFQLFILLLIT